MSSVTKIETAIQSLSVAEQKIIALHLGERLGCNKSTGAGAVAHEGIRFLPRREDSPALQESPDQKP